MLRIIENLSTPNQNLNMNYTKYLRNEPHLIHVSIISEDAINRAKALVLERGGRVAKKESGGVNLFYNEAPASNYSWWEKMFSDAIAPEKEQEYSHVGIEPAQKGQTTQTGEPSQTYSWITKFSTDPYASTQGRNTPASNVGKQQAASYQQVMSYLMDKGGFSKTAAAGIAGVFMAESGLVPGIYNDSERKRVGNRGGRGLGQWSDVGENPNPGWRRTAYEKFLNGRTPTLELDLDFFLEEIKNRPKVLEVLNNPDSTLADVVDVMHRGYENGVSTALASEEQMGYTYNKAWEKDPTITRKYDFNEEAEKRLRFAQQAYDSYNLT